LKLSIRYLKQLIQEELEIHFAPENLDELDPEEAYGLGYQACKDAQEDEEDEGLTQFNEQSEPWRQFTKYIFSNLTDEEKEALEEKFEEEEGKSLAMIINQAINQGWREIGWEGSAEENNKARQQVVERVLEEIKYEAEEALKNKRSKDFWNSEETADLWFLPREIIDNIVVEDGMETAKELHKFLDLVSDFPEDSDEEIVDEIVDFYQRILKKATENHPEKSVEEFEDRLAEMIENHKNQALSDTSDQLNEKKLTKAQISSRDSRAKEIKKSTIKKYGRKKGTKIAFAIATNQAKKS
tara:strand:- start:302 stop:1195 length:894 start_codon:yes stop_codon:yes gene_type:complete